MTKKIKSLQIQNLGKFEEVYVDINEDVTYLVGDNGQGKSYVGIEAIQILFQGIAEKAGQAKFPVIGERLKFIGPNSKSANVVGVIHDYDLDADITISRKIKANEQTISFEAPEGIIIDQEWLNKVFNIFMISPKHFLSLTPIQQSIALGIDLSEHDAKIKTLKEDFAFVNRQIKDFGEVDTAVLKAPKIEQVDITALKEQIAKAKKHNEIEMEKDKNIEDNNRVIADNKVTLARLKKEYEDLLGVTKKLIEITPKMPKGEYIDIDPLDEKYANASTINMKAYTQELAIGTANKYNSLKVELDKRAAARDKEILARTKTIQAKKLPYKELSINDEGELLLEGRYIKEPYFSSGQLIKVVPTLISSVMPDLRYVFIQDFDLLDEANKKSTLDFLLSKGFQVVIETTNTKIKSDNKIVLKNCKVVEDE